MLSLIEIALKHSRTVLLLFGFLVLAGFVSYLTIPKESSPDVPIPIVYVVITHAGISPEDGERLLLKPTEQELQSIGGVKEIKSTAYEGYAVVYVEFHTGVDLAKSLTEVRDKINFAKAKYPVGTDDPLVKEVNVSLFPVLNVELSGDVPERFLYEAGKKIQDDIKGISNVLDAKLVGDRAEAIEVLISPLKLQSYGISAQEIMESFARNNLMVPSSVMNVGAGSFSLKTPGLVKDRQQFFNFPVRATANSVVQLQDIAEIRRSYRTQQNLARSWGQSTVSIEVSKRIGQNIIETIEKVRATVDKDISALKGAIKVNYSQDASQRIKDMLKELQNNILMAIFLVMLVIIASLGWRSALLVGLAVPVSFLSAIFFMGLCGMTLNMVVLFSLILSVGMLVDGAIIVVEYADRKMATGMDRKTAYHHAAIRMAWPVISSIATIVVVFLPLLFWPGVMGQFMKYLPITLMATLTMSLLVALILVPVLGGMVAKLDGADKKHIQDLAAMETEPLTDIKGFTGFYVCFTNKLLNYPGRVLLGAVMVLVLVINLYGKFGSGVQFFPNVEPDVASFLVHARGNFSLDEKDRIVRLAEQKLLNHKEFKSIYTRVGMAETQNAADVIGTLTVEFIDWQLRRPAQEILDQVSKEMNVIPGASVEVRKESSGPSQGKNIQINVMSADYDLIEPEVRKLRTYLDQMSGLQDVEDSRPIPGIQWQIDVDRLEAAKYKANVAAVSNMIQMVGDGLKISTFQPVDSRDEIDVIVRFPAEYRTLNYLDALRISTTEGSIPLSHFIKKKPKQRVDHIDRTDGKPVLRVLANTKPGVLTDTKVKEIKAWIEKKPPSKGVEIRFKGEEADKQETQAFLLKAFAVALFLILVILVTQFDSFFSAMLVLSAVVLSTIGVFLGLLIMKQPFGIVMGGIGVIALAGIIVSNNIIFIDTFDVLVKEGTNVREAILRTGALRLRPIFLTKITCVLGLLPIMARMDIDFLTGAITVGAPSSAWWVQLSTAIVYGVSFASMITLIVTPCALMMRENWNRRKTRKNGELKWPKK
ncbi:MAG: efflux RND transporter permease subunit [Alphaproteobacteria bacterium]